jgi:tetratricopeptide (TPR) repeat protein
MSSLDETPPWLRVFVARALWPSAVPEEALHRFLPQAEEIRSWVAAGQDCLTDAALRSRGEQLLTGACPPGFLASVASALPLVDAASRCRDAAGLEALFSAAGDFAPAAIAVYQGFRRQGQLTELIDRFGSACVRECHRRLRRVCAAWLPEVPSALASLLVDEATVAHAEGDAAGQASLLAEAVGLDLEDVPMIAGIVWRNFGVEARQRGERDEAVASLRKAVAFLRRANRRSLLADALMSLGNVYTDAGDYASAEKALVEAAALFVPMPGLAETEDVVLDRTRFIMNLAVLQRRRGRHAEAYRLLGMALGSVYPLPPDASYARRSLTFRIFGNLANCCFDLRLFVDADEWAEAGEAVLVTLAAERPEDWERDRAQLRKNRAVFLARRGDTTQAAGLFQSARDSLRHLHQANPQSHGQSFAQALLNQADFFRQHQQPAAAEATALEALRVLRDVLVSHGTNGCEDWLAAARTVLRARLDQAGLLLETDAAATVATAATAPQ